MLVEKRIVILPTSKMAHFDNLLAMSELPSSLWIMIATELFFLWLSMLYFIVDGLRQTILFELTYVVKEQFLSGNLMVCLVKKIY